MNFRCLTVMDCLQVMADQLSIHVKQNLCNTTSSKADPDAYLDSWSKVMKVQHDLINVLKKQHSRQYVMPIIKNCRVVLEAFLKFCIPVIERHFATKRSTCEAVLKDTQQSTRYLQYVCTHSKKYNVLTNQVPVLKKTLESFIYAVKSILAKNDAISLFWMGNLKNKNLDGEVIADDVDDDDDDDDAGSVSSRQNDHEEGDLPEEDESDADEDGSDEGEDLGKAGKLNELSAKEGESIAY